MDKKQIRTRIAPSPTGPLHIGTARTALFNYLFAKNPSTLQQIQGRTESNRSATSSGQVGKFILRFEDTDQKRSKKEFEKDIIEGLKWLGLDWDEGPYYQSKDLKIYKKYADELVKRDLAYEKDEAVWFRISDQRLANSEQFIEYDDLIHGKIEFPADKFNDFVIIKRDGLPTFMFGNVVDDHEMKISHVIRGEDHITNTPQQILIYRALGWQPPQFGHIPLILNKDRSKMSKRKDPVSISRDFRDQGYLPEAMINYMALLGWNPKTEREFFTLDELVKEFDLKNVNKSGAIFDIEKLNYFNNHYIREMDEDGLISRIMQNAKCKIQNDNGKLKISKIIAVGKARMAKLTDFDELARPFLEEIKYPSKLLVFKKSNKELTLKGLKLITYNLLLITPSQWQSVDQLNKILLKTVEAEKLSNGDVFWPVRVALSGLEKSPSPAELLWVLGKEESLKRINKAIKLLE